MNKLKKEKKLYRYSFLTVVKRILGMAFAAGPIYIIVNNLLAIVNGVSQGIITYMTQLFFDTVSDTISQNANAQRAIMIAIALTSTIIMSHVINGLNNFMGTSYFKKVTGYLHQKINEKAARIHPIAYENPDTLDDINKAAQGANNSLGLLFTVTTIFTYYSPYFLFMFFYLFSLDKILAVTLIFIFIPVAASQLVRNVVFSKLEDQVAPIRRENEYYKLAIGNKETRILGVFQYFNNLYADTLKLMNKAIWKAEAKTGLLELAMKFLTLIGYLLILLLFVRSLLSGTISTGQFAAVFASINYMFITMNTIICTHIANMTKNMGTMNNFLKFLDMPEKGGADAVKDFNKGICFENVTFAYPKACKPALENISISINKGETIAIVGENGSGKSTFAKLALGIYEPVSGDVRIGGVNTKEIYTKTIRHRVSAVFQNFQKYKMTLKDNITVSDITNEKAVQDKTVLAALEKAGINLDTNTFPAGEETMLSREFDGVELSGGQWQKIAIARGLYRKYDVIIIDEPTAAIDPIEEANIYKKFKEIAKNKTAIIITHRLGSARIANRIIVMKQGGINEIGTHEELMGHKGHYYNMFLQQAKWYQT